ncbi:YaaR family protein [Scopulibacillus cellulosilyticus]|uniref:YaaR family protein n=1 Tax=Scopulibacillus cellulosilyticus TaxID=2665665 RepID=A0ABW2Q030_9BACL
MSLKVQKEQQVRELMKPKRQAADKSSIQFQNDMKSQQARLQEGYLGQLLNKAEGQAKRLAVSRTIKDVQLYKNAVHQFIREALRTGMEMKQSRSWQQPSAPMQTLVQKIDKKLIELTDDVINKERDAIDLLAKIGEIKGLLINLCT